MRVVIWQKNFSWLLKRAPLSVPTSVSGCKIYRKYFPRNSFSRQIITIILATYGFDKIETHINSSVCNRCCSWTCCTSAGLKVNWISIDSFFFRFGPEKMERFFLGLSSWLSTTLTDRMLTLSPNCSAAIDMASLSIGESENSAGRLLTSSRHVFTNFRNSNLQKILPIFLIWK